ncbi:hypothetical protein [Zavarzinia sp. CC-PAN008]|uniref:hypothetical protein n=1 Tax=Zavarzinia sp. CC-PAN008 TaxID=3243332 RepID=UPI003F748826
MAHITFHDVAPRQSWQARQRRPAKASRTEFLLTWTAVLAFCVGTWSLLLGSAL